MDKARKEVELSVRIGEVLGGLGKALATVASRGINVLAYCAYSDRNDSVVLLVTDNPLDAKLALEHAGFQCKANSVVLVGAADQVGAAAKLGASLGSAGIDILYSYASSAGTDRFFAVFKTADDEQAIRVLDAHAWAQAA
ncbi:MAG: hypothetical protein ABSA97_12525 [Verrucomicrobiia bacterium]|jgi:hypothetical protein